MFGLQPPRHISTLPKSVRLTSSTSLPVCSPKQTSDVRANGQRVRCTDAIGRYAAHFRRPRLGLVAAHSVPGHPQVGGYPYLPRMRFTRTRIPQRTEEAIVVATPVRHANRDARHGPYWVRRSRCVALAPRDVPVTASWPSYGQRPYSWPLARK